MQSARKMCNKYEKKIKIIIINNTTVIKLEKKV